MNRPFFGPIGHRPGAMPRRRSPGLEPLESRALLSGVQAPTLGLPDPATSHAMVASAIAATPVVAAAPTLTVTAHSSREIDLSWTAVSGAASYDLQGRLAGTENWYPNNGTSGNITTSDRFSENDDLTPGTTYEYRVRANDGAGNPLSDWSTVVAATTPAAPPLTQPAPTVTATPATTSEIDVAWTAVSGAGSYELQGRVGGTVGWYPANDFGGDATVNGRSYQNGNLSPGETYEFRVRANDGVGNPLSDWSTVVAATTLTTTTTTTHAAPTLTAQSVAPTSVNLSWTAVSGAGSYDLQGRLGGTAGWYPDNGTSGQITTGGQSYQNTGLSPGTTYEYRVRANDAAGNPLTDWSTVVAATTTTNTTTTTQAAPTLTAQSVAPTSMNLSWTAVDGAASYDLQGRLGGTEGWYPDNGTSGQITTSGRFYQNTGLAPGTTYEYRVRAKDAAGNFLTDWSAVVAGTTLTHFG